MSDEYGRVLTPARIAQGFKTQAHLDAFYAHRDHVKDCGECGQPGEPMPLDDGLQPTVRECPIGRALFAASFAEHFTPDESRDLPVCGFCGAAGADDVLREEHYAPIPCCADEDACRARVNRQNAGLPAESRDLLGECPRCGQQSPGVFERCARCVAADRADQGTQDRLFTPTAAPIPGQQTL